MYAVCDDQVFPVLCEYQGGPLTALQEVAGGKGGVDPGLQPSQVAVPSPLQTVGMHDSSLRSGLETGENT